MQPERARWGGIWDDVADGELSGHFAVALGLRGATDLQGAQLPTSSYNSVSLGTPAWRSPGDDGPTDQLTVGGVIEQPARSASLQSNKLTVADVAAECDVSL